MFQEIDTLRYFFSAMMQSIAALFAVGGVFAVFQLQLINQQLNQSYEAFKRFVIVFYPLKEKEVFQWLDKDILHHLLFLNSNKRSTYFKVMEGTEEVAKIDLDTIPQEADLKIILEKEKRIDFGLSVAFADYFIQIKSRADLEKELRESLQQLLFSFCIILFISGVCLAMCEWIVKSGWAALLIVGFLLVWLGLLLMRINRLVYKSLRAPENGFLNNPFVNKLSEIEAKRIQKIVRIQIEMQKQVKGEKEKIKSEFLSNKN